MQDEHVDVLIVGAGLSGIGAGYHLQQKCPGKSYAILEGRETIGGTWDLFRYPGVRSDSDMFTLGYSFRPWTEPKAIADGPRILNYVRETAADNGIDKKIRFNHRVRRASWSTPDARWTVEAERGPVGEGGLETVRFTCNFLFMCSGYYKYAEGYTPELQSELRAVDAKIDSWLHAGAEQFASDENLRRAFETIAKHDDSRRALLLLAEILRAPGLAERLGEVLRPNTKQDGAHPPP